MLSQAQSQGEPDQGISVDYNKPFLPS